MHLVCLKKLCRELMFACPQDQMQQRVLMQSQAAFARCQQALIWLLQKR